MRLNEEILRMWWYDPPKEKNLSAGVAFYDKEYGEYRLKIDLLPETKIYLRPIYTQEEHIFYLAEIVLKRQEKFIQRKQVGEAWSGPETNGDAFIMLGPFSKILVLGLKKLKNVS